MKTEIKAGISIAILVILFIYASYLVQNNEDLIKEYIQSDWIGMPVYVLVFIASIVVAPVGAAPLMPLGLSLWGIYITVFLTVLGWTIGAWIAFTIGRKWGVPIVKRIVPIEDIYKLEKKIPEKNLFLTLLILRITFPFDGISYAFGLFTKMRVGPYLTATIIGLIPMTIATAYFGELNYKWQIFGTFLILTVFLLGYWVNKKRVLKHKK